MDVCCGNAETSECSHKGNIKALDDNNGKEDVFARLPAFSPAPAFFSGKKVAHIATIQLTASSATFRILLAREGFRKH